MLFGAVMKMRQVESQHLTWQFPLNKFFSLFRRNKVYASWKLDANIHLGQPRITFPSPFRMVVAGRSIITLF